MAEREPIICPRCKKDLTSAYKVLVYDEQTRVFFWACHERAHMREDAEKEPEIAVDYMTLSQQIHLLRGALLHFYMHCRVSMHDMRDLEALTVLLDAIRDRRLLPDAKGSRGTRRPTTEPMTTLTFRPQSWQRDYAVDVDPRGPTTWQVPRSRLAGIRMGTHEADNLRHDPAAPQWCQDWTGPFEVEWNEHDIPPTDKPHTDFREAIMRAWVDGWNSGLDERLPETDDDKHACANDMEKQFPLLASIPCAEEFFATPAARLILWLMQTIWVNSEDVHEPYSDVSAIASAINALVDHARQLGCHVLNEDDQALGTQGVKVHPIAAGEQTL